MTQVYLDTSAYLSILLGEIKSQALIKHTIGKQMCSSVMLLLETERNLVRYHREKILTANEYDQAFDSLKRDKEKFLLREVTSDLCLTGFFPPVRLPRSSDLVHLRTARWFQENGGLEAFLTLDESQASSALDFGLHVLAL